jgi:uncharacterized YigZ family protein
MNEAESYKTIDQPAVAEYKDRGSKFLAFANPIVKVVDFKKQLLDLKKEHPKASHHCFAYRIGTDGNTFRASDDGEPAGSAGKPILGQIDSKELTNIGVIVVRYFGGSLLGVPGLINSYKTVTSLVLQLTPIVKKQIEENYIVNFDYTLVNEVMIILKQCHCTIMSQDMQLFCTITTGIPKSRLTEVFYRLKELLNVDTKKLV